MFHHNSSEWLWLLLNLLIMENRWLIPCFWCRCLDDGVLETALFPLLIYLVKSNQWRQLADNNELHCLEATRLPCYDVWLTYEPILGLAFTDVVVVHIGHGECLWWKKIRNHIFSQTQKKQSKFFIIHNFLFLIWTVFLCFHFWLVCIVSWYKNIIIVLIIIIMIKFVFNPSSSWVFSFISGKKKLHSSWKTDRVRYIWMTLD